MVGVKAIKKHLLAKTNKKNDRLICKLN